MGAKNSNRSRIFEQVEMMIYPVDSSYHCLIAEWTWLRDFRSERTNLSPPGAQTKFNSHVTSCNSEGLKMCRVGHRMEGFQVIHKLAIRVSQPAADWTNDVGADTVTS